MNLSPEEKRLLFETPENILFTDPSFSIRSEVLSKLEYFNVFHRQTINELYDHNRYEFLGKLYNFLVYSREYLEYIRSISDNHHSQAFNISESIRNFVNRSLSSLKKSFTSNMVTDLKIVAFVDDCSYYKFDKDYFGRERTIPYIYYEIISILLEDANLFMLKDSKITDEINDEHVNKNYINFGNFLDLMFDCIVVVPISLVKKSDDPFVASQAFDELVTELLNISVSSSKNNTIIILGTSDNDNLLNRSFFNEFNVEKNNIFKLKKPFDLVLSENKISYYNELFKNVNYFSIFKECFYNSVATKFQDKYFIQKKSDFQMLIEQEERNIAVMSDHESKFISQSYEW
jgi:hypothetical protein